MSAIDDSRRVLQDFLAPELREIKARLDAIEKRLDDRFQQVDNRFQQVDSRFKQVDVRFDQAEQVAKARHDALLAALTNIATMNEFRERLARLESREGLHQ